jgi:hypothetical protein
VAGVARHAVRQGGSLCAFHGPSCGGSHSAFALSSVVCAGGSVVLASAPAVAVLYGRCANLAREMCGVGLP